MQGTHGKTSARTRQHRFHVKAMRCTNRTIRSGNSIFKSSFQILVRQIVARARVLATYFARVVPTDHPRKAEGAGKTGWPQHPGLPRKRTFARARKPQVQAETLRPSLRDGLRLIRALLGELCCIATVVAAQPLRLPDTLAPSLSALEPHDFAVRECASRQQAHSRPPHSAPRS
jgi:hypothetical protein